MRAWGTWARRAAGAPGVFVVVAATLAITATSATTATATPAAARAPVVARENVADRATYDPYFAEQWALAALGAPSAWPRSTGGGVRVGVVDTGVDLRHEDLAGKVVASASCLGAPAAMSCRGSAQDDDGHGTSVAGIVAASAGNGKGIAGVAPSALLVVAKSLDARGSGTVADVAAGVRWVVDHGARVVNLSVEADGTTVSGAPGQTLADAVEYAWHHGAIPVIAAGNARSSVFGARGYAGLDAVIVGATGRSGAMAWYSGPVGGAKWGVVAPGGDARGAAGTATCVGALAAHCVVSTGWIAGRANAYVVDEGTSMAAPAVSGVLALLLARGLSPSAAVARLVQSVDPVACGSGCAGRVNAARAVGASARAVAAAPLITARVSARPAVAHWRIEVGLALLVALAALCLTTAAGPSPPSRRS
jgi:subtilisin family serine protease